MMKTPTDYARYSVQCFVDSIVPIQMQQICFCQKKVKVFATSRDISHVFTSCVELKRKIWKRLRMFIMRNTVTIWIQGMPAIWKVILGVKLYFLNYLLKK